MSTHHQLFPLSLNHHLLELNAKSHFHIFACFFDLDPIDYSPGRRRGLEHLALRSPLSALGSASFSLPSSVCRRDCPAVGTPDTAMSPVRL